MATGGHSEGEVGGQIPDSVAGSEDLSELKCQPCHEDGVIREAVGMCVDCHDYLCRKCFDGHTLPRPCRNHQMLDKQQMLKSQVKIQRKDVCTQKCSLHNEKVIEYYCKAHGQLGCNVCLNLDHRTCKPVQYIPHAAINLDKNAEFKATENSLSSALKLCQNVSDIGTDQVELIETSCAEALECLEIHRSNMNDALDKMKAEIVDNAKTMKTRALEKITNITDKYRAAQRELQEFQTRTEQLQRRHQNCDLYTEMMQMKDRLKVLEGEMKEAERKLSLQATHIKFTPNLELLDTLKTPDMLGKLSGGEKRGTIVKAGHVWNINVKTDKNKADCTISGSTLLSDSKLVIVDQNENIIKAVGVKQNRVIAQRKLSSQPWDVCTIKTDQVAVTLPSEKKITMVTIGNNVTVDYDLNVDGKCHGIDFRNDKLAVLYTNPDKVQVMTLQGQLLHDINTTDQQGRTMFNLPYHLTFDHAGTTLYVSNYWGHSVVRVKLDGTLLATYTDGELLYPLSVVVDGDGNVYVCGDGSHSIHQISPDCRKLRVLLRKADGIHWPRAISYSEIEDTFYVGMGNNDHVKVCRADRKS